ncbi:MarR family winged helix-turn-helix transcriptional regulator [Microbacterium kunmingense]|uniref:MarR family winged helix-turn-helix transcriptional regulator n=1 Tax=Microbacterium kunmingense TaxID=2915939 RepID=UPI0020044F73|nr:MarR family transcriptional regulator [Microbacterium kunmingense]
MNPADIAAAWRRERPATPTRSIPVVTALKRTATLLRRERARVLHELGIDEATLDLLSTLRRSGPPYRLTTRDITALTLVSAGAISQRVARAEREGLVRRTPGVARIVFVELTAAGHAEIERAVDRVLAVDDQLVSALTDDELLDLMKLLGKLTLGS